MLIYFVIIFLGLSIVFYCLFGGADFGAGILELFISRKEESRISEVIGPVWEANHVWLILAITILFVGFPKIYSTISVYLHIPIVLLLIGIILRGTAFSFLHYDAVQGQSTVIYNWVFKISSLLTPLFLGVIAGALMLGRINPGAESFYGAYMFPWLNCFSFGVGLFCINLFAFIAAIFIIGEAETPRERRTFVKAAKITQITTVMAGGAVFLLAQWYDYSLVSQFLNSWVALGCILIATCSLVVLWYFLNTKKVWLSRITAGIQLALILFAWFWTQHPVAVNLHNSNNLTFFKGAAPESTLIQLLIALAVGSLLILPSLYFLFRTFKTEER